jgi:hypothetical protein
MTSESKTHKAKYDLFIKTNAPFQESQREVVHLGRPIALSLSYEPNCGEREGVVGVSANEYSCAHRAQKINFGDLTPYI